MDSQAPVEILNTIVVVLDPELKDYNPYDNPGPVPVPQQE